VLEETYEIVDGIRRAKAAELLGRQHINARIIDEDGNTITQSEVPLDVLRSPHKTTIDVSTQRKWDRFIKTFNKTRAGLTPPDILITPGSNGPRLKDVTFDSSPPGP
jgi:hypothetical protein